MSLFSAKNPFLKSKMRGGKKKQRARAATHGSGPTAEGTLLTKVPLFPPSARVRSLSYFEPSYTLTGASGVIAQYAFTANGIYDPNITGTGHQPLGFDTMMTYYDQYTVLNSKITVRCFGNGVQPASVSICLAPDTTSLALPDVVENGYIKLSHVDGRGNGGYGTGNRITEVSLNCDVSSYFGRNGGRVILNDPYLSGTATSNPTEQVYFIINTWGLAGGADNTSFCLMRH